MSDAVSFDRTPEEDETISDIVKRAKLIAEQRGSDIDSLSLHMDLSACHANGCPLRLEELLSADDFNFTHDVFGISRHIDRETGELTGFFLPRFRDNEAAAS